MRTYVELRGGGPTRISSREIHDAETRRQGDPKQNPIPQFRLCLAIALTAAALAAPLAAQEQENRWTLGLGIIALSPTGGEARALLPDGDARFAVSDGSGFGLSLEYRLSRRLGVELTGRFTDLDTELRVEELDGFLKDSDSMGFELFGLGANYNFLPESASLSTSEGLP